MQQKNHVLKKIANAHRLEHASTMDLAAAIKRRRLAAGYTQGELADVLGVDRSAAVRLETAGNLPTIRTLLRVAHALGVSASQLLRDAERLAK